MEPSQVHILVTQFLLQRYLGPGSALLSLPHPGGAEQKPDVPGQWHLANAHSASLPSGELTFCHGKSPFLMGKSTINGHFPLLC